MDANRIATAVGFTIVAAVLAGAGILGYFVGHRAGRGSACLESALAVRDSEGRTLRTLLLSRASAQSDYTFWGTHCTISIGWSTGASLEGGRWAYVPAEGALFADDESAFRLFPGSGRYLDRFRRPQPNKPLQPPSRAAESR
jgi:hypothetical protein